MIYTDTKLKALPWRGVRTPIEELPPGRHRTQDVLHFFTDSDDNENIEGDDLEEIDRILFEELGSTLDTHH